jgi:hypothetical protein
MDENGNLIKSDHDLGQVKISLKVDKTEALIEDLEGLLAGGWVSKVTPEGRILYVNSDTRQTQWNHPSMDVAELPDGWEKRVDDEGRAFYVDTKSGKPGAFLVTWSALNC